MNEIAIMLIACVVMYCLLEFVVERKSGVRKKIIRKFGKKVMRSIGVVAAVVLLYFIMPYRGTGNTYLILFGMTFGIFYYTVVFELREFIDMKR